MTSDTIGDRFDRMADEWPDHDALVSCHQGVRYSFRELQTAVDHCARGFLALSIEARGRIGLWSPASAESVIAMLAAVKIGAELIILDPACGATGLHVALAEYSISLLIVTLPVPGADTLTTLREVCPELGTSPRGQIHSHTLPMLRVVVALGVKRPSGAYNWGDLLALGDQVRPVALLTRQAQIHAANLIAPPPGPDANEGVWGKAVSHQHILSPAGLKSGAVVLTTRDRLCLALPLSHPQRVGIDVLECLTRGATLVLPAAVADPASVLTAIQEECCTVVLDLSGAWRLHENGKADSA